MTGDRFPPPALIGCCFCVSPALVFKPRMPHTVASTADDPSRWSITGTRFQTSRRLETAVPVDVLSRDVFFAIAAFPRISQACRRHCRQITTLARIVGRNDTVFAATLRGLSPDETLVLVTAAPSIRIVGTSTGPSGRVPARLSISITIPGFDMKSSRLFAPKARRHSTGSDAMRA